MGEEVRNLYAHFPFCRRKCSYCALHSAPGSTEGDRAAYVDAVAAELRRLAAERPDSKFDTVYFGGGTPALCDLSRLGDALAPLLADGCEFTVELHPLDAVREKLDELKALGVNRISMGVQSLDDAILAHMGRGYGFHEAERAFGLVRESFDNAGIDLIVGYPGETAALLPRHARLAKWGLKHCSVYSLQNERRLRDVVDDETAMNRISITAKFMADVGLRRYEISNYAVPGFECRHNLAVWRGEDYLGIGRGACGRVGLARTRGVGTRDPSVPFTTTSSSVTADEDRKERTLFRLRTREGLDTGGFPEWRPALDRFVSEGVLRKEGDVYFLTERGTEVCDAVLGEIV